MLEQRSILQSRFPRLKRTSCGPVEFWASTIYYNGKVFCLRGGSEHRSLILSQLSKNRPGGLAQLKLKNKTVKIVANPDALERCHVFLLDKYLSHLPEKAKQDNTFYVRPLDKAQGMVWYSSVPIGRNKLSGMVQQMCKDAGVPGHKTNHSLRATRAMELYTAGVPEKIIQERTGHRSLRMYEKTSNCQQTAVSKILSSTEETTFNPKITNVTKRQQPQCSHSTSCVPSMTFNKCSVNINYNIDQGSTSLQMTGSS